MTDKQSPVNYKLTTNKKRSRDGHLMLNQIQALKDIPEQNVKKGDLGGYIEHTRNLNQYDPCWVGENAQVYGRACVYEHAIVTGEAVIKDHVSVKDNATVKGLAIIKGDAIIKGNCTVAGSAFIEQNAIVTGYATVAGDAHLKGNALVEGRAIIRAGQLFCGGWRGKMQIDSGNGFCCFQNVGSENGTLAAARYQDGNARGIWLTRGCFSGSATEFKRRLEDKYPVGHPIRLEYIALLRAIKSLLDPMRGQKGTAANIKRSNEKAT